MGAGAGGGGSWWGGFTAIASAAVKQGQAALQEIQRNEEAQRWAEQMRGNVGALKGIGMCLLRDMSNASGVCGVECDPMFRS